MVGGRPFVFRARPPRLEPLAPPPPAGIAPPPVRPKDFSDKAAFSMPPVEGVRDVNEVY